MKTETNTNTKYKFNIKEIKDYIKKHPDAVIFFGCDSQKIGSKRNPKKGKRKVRYITVVIVYEKDDNKIFYDMSYEKDIDYNPGKPVMRLMNEVYKVSEIITELQDVLADRKWECHLDINPRKEAGSHCAFHQAVGFIKGVHGINPIVKPDAFAASCIADHIVKKGL